MTKPNQLDEQLDKIAQKVFRKTKHLEGYEPILFQKRCIGGYSDMVSEWDMLKIKIKSLISNAQKQARIDELQKLLKPYKHRLTVDGQWRIKRSSIKYRLDQLTNKEK